MLRLGVAAVVAIGCLTAPMLAAPRIAGQPARQADRPATLLADAGQTESSQLPKTALSQNQPPPPTTYPAYVSTYHYDNGRTGWDSAEINLTPANAGSVQLQHVTSFSGQVDAEPLYVAALNLGVNGVHDLVYVVTENDWVYAIDAESGAIVLRRNLGTPVPQSVLPDQCTNNTNAVGITATPVIDPATGNLYLIAYTEVSGHPTYTLHALNLTTLADSVTPRVIAASGRLANGTTYNFNAAITRQRPALLLSQGTIYAGFGSFCDAASRGWVLGWHESSLAPLGVADLANSNSTAPYNTFLSSIWMAGFGLAADSSGSVYFSTANSDPSGDSWNATTNLEESVVKMAGSLGSVQGYYTPDNNIWGQKPADPVDGDLGSGGVMLLPNQPGATPHLAVAGGKISGALLLNRDNLGGYGDGQLDEVDIGDCWCGPSYFADSSGVGHVVTSFGNAIQTFSIQTSPTPKFANQITSPNISTGQDPGFFTTVSSHGTLAGSAVIWAISRPVNSYPGYINLYAFNPINGQELLAIRAGIWLSPQADANLVPTVANGHIFVASYNQLAIFGLAAPGEKIEITAQPPPEEMPLAADAPHQISGILVASHPGGVTLQTRTGTTIEVDTQSATHFGANEQPLGTPVLVRGDYTGAGFKAVHVLHLKPQPALWPRDR